VAVGGVFQTTTSTQRPFDGNLATADVAAGGGQPGGPGGEAVLASSTTSVSDFVTVQSFANFAVMTGAITAAWKALQRVSPNLSKVWVPYVFAGVWGLVSILTSLDGLKGGTDKLKPGEVVSALFLAIINALVLASAVVGADVATGGSTS
jgi:hypothetical protein